LQTERGIIIFNLASSKTNLFGAIALGVAASAIMSVSSVSADTTSYTVQSGDTLNKIAKTVAPQEDTATAVSQIASANGINNINLIFAGQKLDLSKLNSAPTTAPAVQTPVQQPVAQAPVQSAPTPAPAPAEQPVAPAQAPATQAPASAPAQTSDALQALINRESGGNVNATNGQYFGVGQLSPQARAVYGGNSTDYNDQVNAMKGYISARYGTPENALAHSNATGWY